MTTLPISATVSGKLPRLTDTKWFKCTMAFFLCFIAVSISSYAQVDLDDGVQAIEEAQEGIEGYFEPIRSIIFVMAGIISLLGAIRTYMKWQMGDPDVMATAASWFGSAIFLIVAVTVIESFFGIG